MKYKVNISVRDAFKDRPEFPDFIEFFDNRIAALRFAREECKWESTKEAVVSSDDGLFEITFNGEF